MKTLIMKSLYSSCDSTANIEHLLRATLKMQGYNDYNPFSGLPGVAHTHRVRIFIAPQQNGWIRLIGDVGKSLCISLSTLGTCLLTTLEDGKVTFHVYSNAIEINTMIGLAPYIADGYTLYDLRSALSGDSLLNRDNTSLSKHETPVPLNILPKDVQNMAQNLNNRQINKMFNRFMRQISKQIPGNQQAAAEFLREIDWNSAGTQQLNAVMQCLQISNWHTPDFVTLRDAYQLYHHRKRHPHAPSLPGDEEIMQAVSDVLSYIPVYMGK